MTIPIIHVHTQVDKSTVAYAKFMWETMLALAAHPDQLTITVHAMGPAAADRSRDWIKHGTAVVVPGRKNDALHGSYGHAACIMSALKMSGNGEIHIVADSDTVVIAKGWDNYIRNRLVNDNIGMIGTTYEDLGGFSSGGSTVQTYKKKPTFTWAALQPMHNWRDLDVLPNKAHKIAINTPLLSEIYGLPQGYSVFGEAAYQIPQYLYNNKLTHEGWRQLKPTKDGIVLKGLSDYHEEYHAENIPFVVHHRGSLRHAYRGDRISRQFYAAVDAHLATEVANKPRWTWNDAGKSLSSIVDEPPAQVAAPIVPQEITPESFVPTIREWLKVSFSGAVIKARTNVDRNVASMTLPFTRPSTDKIGHLRVEGLLQHNYPIVVPTATEPYMITVRNVTGAPVVVGSGKKNETLVTIPHNKTWWLLVDIDGVQRVE
jgi:hypothetical protein